MQKPIRALEAKFGQEMTARLSINKGFIERWNCQQPLFTFRKEDSWQAVKRVKIYQRSLKKHPPGQVGSS